MTKGKHIWTPEEDRLLLELWETDTPRDEIARHFNRSPRAVAMRHYKLRTNPNGNPQKDKEQEMLQKRKEKMRIGLEKGREAKLRADTIKAITIEQQTWLVQNYPYISDRLCAMRLGIPESDVAVLAKAMRLTKTDQ